MRIAVKPEGGLFTLAIFLFSAYFLSVDTLAGRPDTGPVLHNGVTAHRGNSGEFPENTLAAFQSGIDIGADWIELDVFRTKDGKLVVIHDGTTERVGNKNLVVADSTYEQLLAVDVATDFRQRNNKPIETVPKHTIPLLEEVLRLVMTQNKTRVSIQPKMNCVADAIAPDNEDGGGEMGWVQRWQSSVHGRGKEIGTRHTSVLGSWRIGHHRRHSDRQTARLRISRDAPQCHHQGKDRSDP